MPDPPVRPPLTKAERLNVVFVVAASQLVQVLLVAMVTATVFFILGLIVLSPPLLDGHPEPLALSGNGESLYVADYWAGTLTAISIASVVRDAEAA